MAEEQDIGGLTEVELVNYMQKHNIEPDLANPEYQRIYELIQQKLMDIGAQIERTGCNVAVEDYKSLVSCLPEEERESALIVLKHLMTS